MQPEKQVQNQILKYLNHFLTDSFAYEIYNGGVPACARGNRIIYKTKGEYRPNGMPDIVWVWNGVTRFIETKVKATAKTKKTYLKPEQREIHARILDCGGEVLVIRSLREIQEYIQSESCARITT